MRASKKTMASVAVLFASLLALPQPSHAEDIAIDIPAESVSIIVEDALMDFIRNHGKEYEITPGVTLADVQSVDVVTSRARTTAVQLLASLNFVFFVVPIAAELVVDCDFGGPSVQLQDVQVLINVDGVEIKEKDVDRITTAANNMLEEKTGQIVDGVWSNMADMAATADAHKICPTVIVADDGALRLELDFVLGCITTDTKVTACSRGFRGTGSHHVCRNGKWVFVSRDCEPAQ